MQARQGPGRYAVNLNPPITDTGFATPDCLKPDVEPPYTALGRKTMLSHKPVEGYRMVADAVNNDPLLKCDPGGFPRLVLHEFQDQRDSTDSRTSSDPV